MRRFKTLVRKRSGQVERPPDPSASPEDNVVRGVKLFCESGSENNTDDGENESFLHLPALVEAAESSPAAARAAAIQIRRLIKDNYQKPTVQYNAIMLIRILTDNPGPSFTKNIDEKFILTIKTLLQQGRHLGVRQMLMETLHALETEKAYDNNLVPLTAMWIKERGIMMMSSRPPPGVPGAQYPAVTAMAAAPPRPKTLPPPAELAGRIEEGRMSAQLLSQLTQSTPTNQVLDNALMTEFAQRCQSANRSLQGYMSCTDPAPDEQTFQTLIEITEQLNVALSKHQRAILAARRELGATPPAAPSPPPNAVGPIQSPPLATHPAWLSQPVQSPPLQVQQTNETTSQQTRSTNPFITSPRNTTTTNPATITTSSTTSTSSISNGLYGKATATLFPRAAPRQPVKGQAPTSNPFADVNEIPLKNSSSQKIPAEQPAVSTPEPGTTELPASQTPPIGATLLGPPPISSMPLENLHLEDDVEPPPGPPPPKTSTLPTERSAPSNAGQTLTSARFDGGAISEPITQESDDDDLYGTSTISPPRSPERNPPSSFSPQPVSPPATAKTSAPRMSGANSASRVESKPKSRFRSDAPPPPPPKDGEPRVSSSGGRIIDDEPMSPMAFPNWDRRP